MKPGPHRNGLAQLRNPHPDNRTFDQQTDETIRSRSETMKSSIFTVLHHGHARFDPCDKIDTSP